MSNNSEPGLVCIIRLLQAKKFHRVETTAIFTIVYSTIEYQEGIDDNHAGRSSWTTISLKKTRGNKTFEPKNL
jgi:hypothetical protein